MVADQRVKRVRSTGNRSLETRNSEPGLIKKPASSECQRGGKKSGSPNARFSFEDSTKTRRSCREKKVSGKAGSLLETVCRVNSPDISLQDRRNSQVTCLRR